MWCVLLLFAPVPALQWAAPQRVHQRINAGRATRASAVRADGGLFDLLNTPPIVINRMEVLDPSKGVLSPISGVTVTPSGYLGLFLILVQQLFAPWGWISYSKRLKEDEQGWLDAGLSPEQAVINAYNNARPPKAKPPADSAASESSESSESAASADVETVESADI